MNETVVNLGLSGHKLLVLKMAVDGELQFWQRLREHAAPKRGRRVEIQVQYRPVYF